ncbi:MAG: 30S ribosome-binding factor RbfA [Spirochaetes bacterium]|jgi:ribosome-binding factor A|nr:30S ribosome-binding factor RbfA [Spirochaetota bacterium]
MAYRKEKIEELIKRIVAELLIKDIKDPRIGFASITGVKLSGDKTLARIGISVMGDPRDLRKTMEGIKSAQGYIQHRVGKELRMRIMPRIEFFMDSSVADAVEMVDLLNRLEKSECQTEGNTDDKNGGGD